jgi:hypothetical protein
MLSPSLVVTEQMHLITPSAVTMSNASSAVLDFSAEEL